VSSKEGSGGSGRHDRSSHNQRRKGKDVNSSAPVILPFQSFQEELVKLHEGITVKSKRTVFPLHRITSVPDMEEMLTDSEIKLDSIRQKAVQGTQELSGEDMHQLQRAVTTGLKERVDVISFKHLIRR
uniref:Uncharacterized protein n=1 Tax=Suricata suricatta TaxID=37032 RepID=A0A673TDZ5_SURSU